MAARSYQLGEPLAYLLRPTSLEEFFGQEELVGERGLLRKMVESDMAQSMIFYGPPGVGKTTLAQIIAKQTKSNFVTISAVAAGVAEIRKVVEEAEAMKRLGSKTILFVDEIHRFNKGQQDALLPHTENGTVVLIGATTENPSFEVNSALLSRAQVFLFKQLSAEALAEILARALQRVAELQGEGKARRLQADAVGFLVGMANGDARTLLNQLEMVLRFSESEEISLEEVKQILQKKFLRYDKKGEEHYNIISALHKSLRDSDPDGALYWMMRMLAGGEDPLYIARRLVRFASEDIGMADPFALQTAIAAQQACHFIGLPECEVSLGQAVVHLATAPKSNAVYAAINAIKSDIAEMGNLEVPLHIRNAPTKMMKEWGYGKGYQYAHDFADAKVDQQHLPDQLIGRRYYFPTDRGHEGKIKGKLEK